MILIIVAIAMIGAVLVQRSEGGALGIGGPNAMFSARGSANFLTRITAGLATAFMILSLALAILSSHNHESGSVLDTVTTTPSDNIPVDLKGGELETKSQSNLGKLLKLDEEITESQDPAVPIGD